MTKNIQLEENTRVQMASTLLKGALEKKVEGREWPSFYDFKSKTQYGPADVIGVVCGNEAFTMAPQNWYVRLGEKSGNNPREYFLPVAELVNFKELNCMFDKAYGSFDQRKVINENYEKYVK